MRTLNISIVLATLILIGCSDDSSPAPGLVDDSGNGDSDLGATPDSSNNVNNVADLDDSDDTGSGSVDMSTDTTPDLAVDPFPNGLMCQSISLCSTYEADPSRVPFPETTGGTLRDGLYRAVQGTNIPYGLAISGNTYAIVFENMTVSFGDFTIEEDKMLQNRHTICGPGLENNDPAILLELETFFSTDGTELITYSGCDSLDPNQCSSPTRLIRVESLCDGLENLSCPSGDCNCATFEDGVIPPRPGNDNCEF